MKLVLKAFGELSTEDLYNILAIRSEVFVVEQDCVYQDLDGKDASCHHLYYTADHAEIAAYARLIPPGVSYASASIGRILVAQKFRQQKLGRNLVAAAIKECHTLWPMHDITIGAQSYLKDFYCSFGFEQVDEEYLEDGIPHIQMQLNRTAI